MIPGLGRASGEGNGNPLRYSCLENLMDRGAWRATVHGVARVGHDSATKPAPLSTWVGGPGSSPTSFKLTICYRWVPVHPVYVRSFIHLFIQVFNICQAIVLVPREQERHGPCLQERKTDPS